MTAVLTVGPARTYAESMKFNTRTAAPQDLQLRIPQAQIGPDSSGSHMHCEHDRFSMAVVYSHWTHIVLTDIHSALEHPRRPFSRHDRQRTGSSLTRISCTERPAPGQPAAHPPARPTCRSSFAPRSSISKKRKPMYAPGRHAGG